MKRIDKVMIQLEREQHKDDLQLSIAFIHYRDGKYYVTADLWDGVEAPRGRTERLTSCYDTEEEAEAAIEEIREAHKPIRGKKALEPVIITLTPRESVKSA